MPRRLPSCLRGPARQLAALALAAAPLLPLAVPAAAAEAPALPVPAPAVAFPSGIEALPSYVASNSCEPDAKPGVVKFAALLQRTYVGTGSSGIVRDCAGEASTSEHTQGRAFDWRVSIGNPLQVAQVRALTTWLLATDAQGHPAANARRLGIMYLIWDKQILGLYGSAGWRPYACSGVTSCHQDHVHFSLTWAGARGVTSFWTGTVAADDYGPCVGPGQMFAVPTAVANPVACPGRGSLPVTSPVIAALRTAPDTVLQQGSTGAAVAAVQQALGGTPADGDLGPTTRGMVLLYERRRRLPATGTVTRAVRADLVSYVSGGRARLDPVPAPAPAPAPVPAPVPPAPAPGPVPAPRPVPPADAVLRQGSHGAAVVLLQRALQVTADGSFGPRTRAALVRFQQLHRLVATGVTDPGTWAALRGAPAGTPPAPPATAVLRLGSTGPAVVALQRRLRLAASGRFDAATRAAVIAFQAAHHLSPDGVVGPRTRAALG